MLGGRAKPAIWRATQIEQGYIEISLFHAPLFYFLSYHHTKLRSLGNNVLEAFKINRFYFFNLRGDLGGLEASELENRKKQQQDVPNIRGKIDF